ncbi:unnamed protein product, partial [Thelazia callipaeda]|uniref:SAM-dependent methyltransferase n=1 Tax=Thelazia callipaeda TaxID=103827 RepID=A0A0N5D8V4_THECL
FLSEETSPDLEDKTTNLFVSKNSSECTKDHKSKDFEENDRHSEKQDSVKVNSRKEFYLRENEIKIAKSTGVGIGDGKFGAYLMDLLISKSPDKNTLNGMTIAMFDFHSIRFAERLLNAGVSSLSIVETSQNEAQKAKVYMFARYYS